jgi:hypothetical protein
MKMSTNRRIPVYHYGIEFEKNTMDVKDAITVYNFSFAVKKMMTDISFAGMTPLLKLNDMIKKNSREFNITDSALHRNSLR